MQQFIEKYGDEIVGRLSGHDRVVYRATPRRLNAFYRGDSRNILVAKGMQEYLWQNKILFKDFGRHVERVSRPVGLYRSSDRGCTRMADPAVERA